MSKLVMLVLLLEVVTATFLHPSVVGPEPDLGYFCSNFTDRGLKYYFDEERMQVYPFYYKGCPLNTNNDPKFYPMYNSREEAPILMDYVGCAGYASPTGNCLRQGFEHLEKYFPDVHGCPAGSSCEPNWVEVSICCDDTIAAEFAENRLAKCDEGYAAVPDLFGRKCGHNFCPHETQCVEGKFEAYCCAPAF